MVSPAKCTTQQQNATQADVRTRVTINAARVHPETSGTGLASVASENSRTDLRQSQRPNRPLSSHWYSPNSPVDAQEHLPQTDPGSHGVSATSGTEGATMPPPHPAAVGTFVMASQSPVDGARQRKALSAAASAGVWTRGKNRQPPPENKSKEVAALEMARACIAETFKYASSNSRCTSCTLLIAAGGAENDSCQAPYGDNVLNPDRSLGSSGSSPVQDPRGNDAVSWQLLGSYATMLSNAGAMVHA